MQKLKSCQNVLNLEEIFPQGLKRIWHDFNFRNNGGRVFEKLGNESIKNKLISYDNKHIIQDRFKRMIFCMQYVYPNKAQRSESVTKINSTYMMYST